MNIKKALFLVILIMIKIQITNGQFTLNSAEEFTNINLEEGMAYDGFTASDNYLAWLELYKKEVFIYDLSAKSLEKVKLSQGRGPFESRGVSALGITESEKLILNDVNNIKFIIYDLKTGKFEKEIKFDSKRLMRISTHKEVVFSLGIRDENSLYHVLDIENDWNSKKVDFGNKINVSKEFSSIYKRDGYISSNHLFGVHAPIYYPSLFIIDFKTNSLLGEIKYDEIEPVNFSNKKELIDVEFEVEDVVFLPNSDHRLILLANGTGENRDYSLNQLRVFNIEKEKFEYVFDLDFNVSKITANSNNIIIYSKEENAIYSYEINKQ